jgi:hypothetical protein
MLGCQVATYVSFINWCFVCYTYVDPTCTWSLTKPDIQATAVSTITVDVLSQTQLAHSFCSFRLCLSCELKLVALLSSYNLVQLIFTSPDWSAMTVCAGCRFVQLVIRNVRMLGCHASFINVCFECYTYIDPSCTWSLTKPDIQATAVSTIVVCVLSQTQLAHIFQVAIRNVRMSGCHVRFIHKLMFRLLYISRSILHLQFDKTWHPGDHRFYYHCRCS